jgi:hypothetical protein
MCWECHSTHNCWEGEEEEEEEEEEVWFNGAVASEKSFAGGV